MCQLSLFSYLEFLQMAINVFRPVAFIKMIISGALEGQLGDYLWGTLERS